MLEKRFFPILGIVVVIILGFGGCSKKSQFEGAWKNERAYYSRDAGTNHLIFQGDNWILLEDGDETARGTFQTNFKTSKENTFITLHYQYKTIYFDDYPPFTEEISLDEEYKYQLEPGKSLKIEELGIFTKAIIPSEEMKKIQNTFNENCNNPDMRNNIKYDDQIYSTRFNLQDIRRIIAKGNFEDVITNKEIKNGCFSNNTLFWTDNSVFLDVLHLRKVGDGIIKKGDAISIGVRKTGLLVEPEENWNKAVYIGDDKTFNSLTSNRRYFLSHRVFCKLSFIGGNPVIEVIGIFTSQYY